VYALGAILYELLTGRPPFKSATSMDTLLQVLVNEPVPLRQLQPQTPRDLETVCLKCLEKTPARRYASAAELADDLRRVPAGGAGGGGGAGRARAGGKGGGCLRWAKRRPGVAALLATLAGVVTVSLLGLTALWLQADSARAEAVTQGYAAARARTEAEQRRDALAGAKLEVEKQRDTAARARTEAEKQRDLAVRAKNESEARRQVARRHPYGAHRGVMQIAWRDRLFDHLQDLLDRQAPRDGDVDLRGFECHYCERLLERSRRTLTGHADAVTAVALSADRRHLASGGRD